MAAQAPDIPGPAANIPEYLVALELLIVRGCTVEYNTGAQLGEMQCYRVRHPYISGTSTRMMWADARGAKQALQLLEELNKPDDVYDAMAARYSKALAKSMRTAGATMSEVLKAAWHAYEKEPK
jgi:hypothetical protein